MSTPTTVEETDAATEFHVPSPFEMRPGLIARFIGGTGAYGYSVGWSIGYWLPDGTSVDIYPGDILRKNPEGGFTIERNGETV